MVFSPTGEGHFCCLLLGSTLFLDLEDTSPTRPVHYGWLFWSLWGLNLQQKERHDSKTWDADDPSSVVVVSFPAAIESISQRSSQAFLGHDRSQIVSENMMDCLGRPCLPRRHHLNAQQLLLPGAATS
jgi:hypothetical protein